MKVVIIEDEPILLRELSRMLMSIDEIQVEGCFVNPLEALEQLEQIKPEAIFLDIEMPGMSGMEFAEICCRTVPDVSIVFATAYNHYAAEAFSVNAVDYLLKPIRPERLEKAAQKLLQLHKDNIRGKKNSEKEQRVRIQSFGKFSLYIEDQPIKWSRSKQQELFAFLLSQHGRWVDKYKICDELWNSLGPEQGLANLQTAIWAIRKLFREKNISNFQIEYQGDNYVLHVKNVEWDKIHVDQLLEKGNKETLSHQECKELKKWYGMGYLFYDDWVWAVLEKSRYERLYMEKVYQNKKKQN